MTKDVNGKREKVSEIRGGGHSGGGRRPYGRGFNRPVGGHVGGGGHRGRFYARGARRPFWGVGGGWLLWNGTYWVDPNGMCYFENDYGQYIAANCIANNPIATLKPDVLLFTGFDGKEEKLVSPPSSEKNISDKTIKNISLVKEFALGFLVSALVFSFIYSQTKK